MESTPKNLKIFARILALLIVAILIGRILGMPYRATRPPSGGDQPRAHLNTKNTTRFVGGTSEEVANLISRAVYLGVDETNRPGAVLVYDPSNWQAALAAASLMRPMQAVLLPAGEETADQIGQLQPIGASALGSSVFLLDGLEAPAGVSGDNQPLVDIPGMWEQLEASPRQAILVDRENPQTALLAVAWALLGMASAGWILFHQEKFLMHQNWITKMAWPLIALMIGPFVIPLYYLAYNRPVIKLPNGMLAWDHLLWLQGLGRLVLAGFARLRLGDFGSRAQRHLCQLGIEK